MKKIKLKCIDGNSGNYNSIKFGVIYEIYEIIVYPEDTYYRIVGMGDRKFSHKRFVDIKYERNKAIDYILND